MRAAVVGLRIHNSKPVVFLYSSTGVMQEGLAIAKEQGRQQAASGDCIAVLPSPSLLAIQSHYAADHGSWPTETQPV